MISAVVFDLDGTLVDTLVSAPAAYANTLRSLGGLEVSAEDVLAAWHLGPTPVVLAHFLGRAITSADLECFYECFATAMATVQPFPGVLEMMGALRGAGYFVGVFTTATRRAATLMVTNAALGDYIMALVGGDEVDEPKPDPAGLRLTCLRLGVVTDEAAYVGDTEADLICAQAAGSLPIHASWGALSATTSQHSMIARRPSEVIKLLQ